MDFTALSCPQCGGALPRQAYWRMVTCPYCQAQVTLAEDLVHAEDFHRAWLRAQNIATAPALCIGAQKFRLIAPLGGGETAEVFLAERQHILPERVIIKLARPGAPASALAEEYQTLKRLQALDGAGAAYFSQRLPQAVLSGQCLDASHAGRFALVLRHPVGYWGSLASVLQYQPSGIDPRHVVWIWRRVLDMLGFIHPLGWMHGRINPEHLLVHPRDHGILLIGWRAAHPNTHPRADAAQQIAQDLMHTAWSMRSLLTGDLQSPGVGPHTPAPLAKLLEQASEDAGWCLRQSAAGIDQALRQAAREAFGPPRFLEFIPIAHTRPTHQGGI